MIQVCHLKRLLISSCVVIFDFNLRKSNPVKILTKGFVLLSSTRENEKKRVAHNCDSNSVIWWMRLLQNWVSNQSLERWQFFLSMLQKSPNENFKVAKTNRCVKKMRKKLIQINSLQCWYCIESRRRCEHDRFFLCSTRQNTNQVKNGLVWIFMWRRWPTRLRIIIYCPKVTGFKVEKSHFHGTLRTFKAQPN